MRAHADKEEIKAAFGLIPYSMVEMGAGMGPDYLEAMKLIPQRRYDEAASLLIEICRANPGVGEPWTVLALCLLCLERYADLQGIIELRQRQAGDGLRLFNDSLGVALERSEHAAIRNVLAAVPSDSALTVVARYWAGLVAALDGEADRGIGLIHEAARLISALPPNLAQESFIATIATEACLLEPSAIVAEIEQADPQKLLAVFPGVAATLTPVIVPRDAATESFVFLSSCDQRYLEKFGETVVRALDATRARTVYHLHVIDPSPDVASIVARLQAGCSSLTLGYSTEAYGGADQGYSRAEFYACGRLIRLPEIFALYDRDVFMWDVDTNAVNDFALVVAAMKGGGRSRLFSDEEHAADLGQPSRDRVLRQYAGDAASRPHHPQLHPREIPDLAVLAA